MPNHSGLTNIILSIPFLTLGIVNLLNQINLNKDLVQRSYLTVPFILFGILIFIVNKKILFSVLFLFIAIFTMIDPTSGQTDYSASIFIIFAFHLIQKRWYGIFLSSSTLILIAIKSTNQGLTIYQSFAVLIGFFVVYTLYYIIIYRSLPKPIKANLRNLTKQENKLIELMAAGYPQGSAGLELNHKDKTVTSKMISDIREKLNIDQSEANTKIIAIYTKYSN